jgi:spermidine/putrescine transport system permease protein
MAKIFKKSYIYIILVLFYLPILFGTIFSFNKQLNFKSEISFTSWNGFSFQGYLDLFDGSHNYEMLNSLCNLIESFSSINTL